MNNFDYTTQYNTPIPDELQKKFSDWMAEYSKRRGGADVSRDLYDYDLMGAFMAGINPSSGHLPDTFKKPNHPTFSDQSQYSIGPTRTGGKWGTTPGPVSVDTFTASPFNRRIWKKRGLQRYFKRVEPNSMLYYGDENQ